MTDALMIFANGFGGVFIGMAVVYAAIKAIGFACAFLDARDAKKEVAP